MFMLECKSTLSVNTSLLLQVSCFMYDFRICTLKPQKGMVHFRHVCTSGNIHICRGDIVLCAHWTMKLQVGDQLMSDLNLSITYVLKCTLAGKTSEF